LESTRDMIGKKPKFEEEKKSWPNLFSIKYELGMSRNDDD